MTGPQAALIAGGRLHLHHGPIDLVIDAQGPEREKAFACAWNRFRTILEQLVEELPSLRQPLDPAAPLAGPVARRMAAAVAPFAPEFITPMAAVAGAVADETLSAMTAGARLTKAYVNNGGDAALHLMPGQAFRAMIAAPGGGVVDIGWQDAARGLATSGWRGRSHSFGIADAVTVVARCSAMADAAATMIANAVDLPGHPAILRRPACELAPDSDLGHRLVTVGVGSLDPEDIAQALDRGLSAARSFAARGLIDGAHLVLGQTSRTIGGHATAAPFPSLPEPVHA